MSVLERCKRCGSVFDEHLCSGFLGMGDGAIQMSGLTTEAPSCSIALICSGCGWPVMRYANAVTRLCHECVGDGD